jgi:hypothetical protein
LLSACALDAEPDLASTADDITGGTSVNPNPRPEIGEWNGCTATMIRPNWILLAAHCFTWSDARNWSGTSSNPTFNTTATGDGHAISAATMVDRTFSFSGFAGELGGNDVMLAHLSSVPTGPANIVPATIATAAPTSGTVTDWGFGCNTVAPQTGFDFLRFRESAPSTQTHALCPGDSGGPKVIGDHTQRGAIYQINSGFDNGFSNPTTWRTTIDRLIADWDTNGWADIYMNRWCTGANERRFEIDADGDGQADALCWNSSTGAEQLAVGVNRLIRPSSTLGSFCSGGRELLTGDFDGDRITDLLCHDKTTGQNFIDFGRDGYNGFGGTTIAVPNFGWCSHATGQLHTGDFNGDGRTDLLCHDTATGHKWLDYAAATPTIFAGTDYESTNNFCSHVGAKLLVGDIDGNGRSDLICHTPSTGQLHFDRTYAGDVFNGVDETLDPIPSLDDKFCQSGRVEVGDYQGLGNSSLKCVTQFGTWGSLFADGYGNFSYDRTFGYSGDIGSRSMNAASRPWSYER